MEIIVGKNAGFCFGVKNAVDNTIKELENSKKVYCLGELVHNKQVSEELKNKGAIFIDNIEGSKGTTIIRAHGVTKQVYEKAKQLNLQIKDLTCPKVLGIHTIAQKYTNDNYFIFLVGQLEHPETIGTISFCGDKSIVIQSTDDIEKAVDKFKKSNVNNALIIAQTTFSLEKFNNIAKKIQKEIPEVEIKNTICSATKLRQEETEELSKNADAMIVVGGKHSSNANKLYEIANKNCNLALFVETKDELDTKILKNCKKVGIMAGASTPQKSIDELVDIIKKI